MSNGKKNTPYLTSPDKSFIASSLSDEQIAFQKLVKAYRQHKRKTSDAITIDDDKAFNMMEDVADKTNVDILAEGKKSSTKEIHTALLAAGMTPAYGNIADVADATLYALEGEFGEAAWSAASALPIIGQMVAGKRALKAAKETGEKMVTLYRGVGRWYPGRMVENGKFVSSGEYSMRSVKGGGRQKVLYTSMDRRQAEGYAGFNNPSIRSRGVLLEFEVPESYLKENALNALGKKTMKTAGDLKEYPYSSVPIFKDGLPKEFLKKVHLGYK